MVTIDRIDTLVARLRPDVGQRHGRDTTISNLEMLQVTLCQS